MTFKELEAALGEPLVRKDWKQFVHEDGQPGGWFEKGQGVTVDPTAEIDLTAVVRGPGTTIGRFVILGPGVLVEDRARIEHGPVLSEGAQVSGPFYITGRKTELVGPDVKVWWNAAPELRAEDADTAKLTNVTARDSAHISGRVLLTEVLAQDGSTISGPHGEGTATRLYGANLTQGSTAGEGATVINSDLVASTASGFGTQVIESHLNQAVAPVGQQTKDAVLDNSPKPPAPRPTVLILAQRPGAEGEEGFEEGGYAQNGEEEEAAPSFVPRRRARPHLSHTGFRRCSHRPTAHPETPGQEKT
ncbi:MAG: hypothetical protein PW734_05295 [Verrucomicrobium sp.]|nr:hypothetical protein [Verrucomicrobium sp.]